MTHHGTFFAQTLGELQQTVAALVQIAKTEGINLDCVYTGIDKISISSETLTDDSEVLNLNVIRYP